MQNGDANILAKYTSSMINIKDTFLKKMFPVKWKISIIDHFRHA